MENKSYQTDHFPGRIIVQQKPDPTKRAGFMARLSDAERKKKQRKNSEFDRIINEASLKGIEVSTDVSNRILRAPVNETVFINIVNNGLDFLIWDVSAWATSRLYESKKGNKIKEYSLIEIYITFKGLKHSVICEYQGFFTTQSNHEVTYNEYTQFVRKGSYVLKLGRVLKIN